MDVCSVWANPATVGLLGVLLASCCCSFSVTGWLDVWAISARVSVACPPPPLQCVGQPSSRRATGRTASVSLQTVGHPSSCWATGRAFNDKTWRFKIRGPCLHMLCPPAPGHDAFERALSHGDVIACCVPDSKDVFTFTDMLSYEDGRFLILISKSQGSCSRMDA